MTHLDKSLTTVDESKKQPLDAEAAFTRWLAEKEAEIAELKKLDGPSERQLKAELLVRYTNLEAMYESLKKVQLGCAEVVRKWVAQEVREFSNLIPADVIPRGRSAIEILIEHNLERVSAAALVHAQKQCDDAIRRDRENHELRKRAAYFDRTLAERAASDKQTKIERDEAVRDKLIAEGQIRDLTWKLNVITEGMEAPHEQIIELRNAVSKNKELVATAKATAAANDRLRNAVKKASDSIEAARNQLAHTIDE